MHNYGVHVPVNCQEKSVFVMTSCELIDYCAVLHMEHTTVTKKKKTQPCCDRSVAFQTNRFSEACDESRQRGLW